jgi:hypothetical protein
MIICFFFSSQMQIRAFTMSGSAKVVKTKLFIGNLDPGTQAGMRDIHNHRFGMILGVFR